MPTIDEHLQFGPNDCPRCGFNKNYHTMIVDGKVYIPCIRKKPYKLKDGVDVKLGMQVWYHYPFDETGSIITGMVRFISSFGGLSLWRYVEDRIPETRTINDVVINLPGPLSYDVHPNSYVSCFSSLANAQAFVEKKKKEREALEKWRIKNKISY